MFIIGWNTSNCHNVKMNETSEERKIRKIYSIENETKEMSSSDNELINFYILRYFIRNECVNSEQRREKKPLERSSHRKKKESIVK